MMSVENMRWFNQSHPQTLQIGVILLYIDGVLSLFRGAGLLLGVVAVGAAVGIANDKRIGWYAGIAVSAIFPLILAWILWNDGLGQLFDFDFMIAAVFPIAQLVALLHTQTQSHVKVWFQ